MHRVGQFATLNANYNRATGQAGFQLAYPSRRATHEFIVTYQKESELGVNAMDMAKRLLDYGVHSPTGTFRYWCRNAF